MYKRKLKLVTFLLALVLVLSQAVVFAEEVRDFAVEIVGGEKEVKLGLEELKSMGEEAQIHEEYIYNSKAGQKSVMIKGVSLSHVLRELAGIGEENAEIIFEASDGYPIDPQSLEDILNEDLKYVLAYEIDGEAIDNDGNPDNEEIVVYRKVKEEGEFGTVSKLVVKISVGQAIDASKQVAVDQTEESTVGVSFDDIGEKYEFARLAIEKLAEKGIVSGVGPNRFAPEQEFTRAQFCKIMVDALAYGQVEYTGGFSDVEAGKWFAPYVESAVTNGLFAGYTDSTFRPDQVITRQEMASVVGRAVVLADIVEEAKMGKFTMDKSKFEDKDLVPQWAGKEVAWLEAQGVFADIATESFQPTKLINRAEAALIVYNALFSE